MKTYICWNKRCPSKKKELLHGKEAERITEEQMEIREEDENHIDYCCPLCGKVIICESEGNKKEYETVVNT